MFFLRAIRSTASLVGLAAAFALSQPTNAQCPTPDLLDGGPCCTQAQPNILRATSFTQDALDICWRDCDVEAIGDCRAEWRRPLFVPSQGACAPQLMILRLRDTAGNLKWRGAMRLTYARTWFESSGGGADYQVWRFLVNGDLLPTALVGPAPCPLPPCAPAHNNRVKFTGYIDYARECSTGTLSHAWMLTHACDQIDHAPGFPRGGIFHPDRSYTFVGPAGGFVVSGLLPTEGGGGPIDSVRRQNLPVPGTIPQITCEYEEFIDHNLTTINNFCVCSGAALPQQWMLGNLIVGGGCGTGIFTSGGPFLPGFLSMGIGFWSDPTTYPGEEALRWNTGGYDYADPCVGITRQEVFYGVTTLGGYAAQNIDVTGIGSTLPLTFVDQANSLRGGAGFSTTVMNVPFATDHIINLNH